MTYNFISFANILRTIKKEFLSNDYKWKYQLNVKYNLKKHIMNKPNYKKKNK